MPARTKNVGQQNEQRAPPSLRLPSNQISYSENRVQGIVLTEQLSIGIPHAEQQSFLVVAVRLLPPALGPMHAPGEEPDVVRKTHVICDKRLGGLEYSRRGQEAVLRLLRPSCPRQSKRVDVPTASLFTNMLKIGMLSVVIAHMRRSPLPMSAAPPASHTLQAAPNVHNAFIESAIVCFYHGEKPIKSFDLADLLQDEVFEVNLGLNGDRLNSDGPYKVQLQHLSSPQHRRMRIERFNACYILSFRNDLEDLWFDALMRASQQRMQAEAAAQEAVTRKRRSAWASVVRQACLVAVDFRRRSKAMKAMSKARAEARAKQSCSAEPS